MEGGKNKVRMGMGRRTINRTRVEIGEREQGGVGKTEERKTMKKVGTEHVQAGGERRERKG